MKRVLVFAFLAGLSAAPLAARADDLPAPGGALQPQAPNLVAPEAPRGQLGGLASGAPGFAANVQQLRGQLDGQALGPTGPTGPIAPAAAAPGGPAPAAGGIATTAVVAEKQTIAPAQSHRMVRMMMHHCLRAHFISKGMHPAFMPFPVGGPLFITPPGAPSIGDLELLGVGIVADAVDETGPIYRVTFQNNSRIPARHFRVSLIAIHGELTVDSPVMTMLIDELAPGAVGHIDVQLPCGVMAMGPKDQPVPFQTLVAVVDSFDELIEDTKLNNVATFTRGQIAVIETAEAVAPAAAGLQAGVAAPAPGAVAAPAPGGPIAGGPPPQGVAPGPAAAPPPAGEQPPPAAAPAPAPQDSSILDQLDLDVASGTSQLFSR